MPQLRQLDTEKWILDYLHQPGVTTIHHLDETFVRAFIQTFDVPYTERASGAPVCLFINRTLQRMHTHQLIGRTRINHPIGKGNDTPKWCYTYHRMTTI